ncbi:MAG: hypothetical protein ACK493_00065 [Planctomycetota bacterium]
MSQRALAVAKFECIRGENILFLGHLSFIKAAVIIEEVDGDFTLGFHRFALVVIEEDSSSEASFAGLSRLGFHGICPNGHDFVGRFICLVSIPGEGSLDVERLASAAGQNGQAKQNGCRTSG